LANIEILFCCMR